MGRHRRTEPRFDTHVYLSPEIRALLQAYAKQNDRSVTSVIRIILQQWFDREKARDD